MNDKSWVGQWLALMLGGALIVCVVIQMLTEATVPQWFIGLAIGFVGVHRLSREVEKRKNAENQVISTKTDAPELGDTTYKDK